MTLKKISLLIYFILTILYLLVVFVFTDDKEFNTRKLLFFLILIAIPLILAFIVRKILGHKKSFLFFINAFNLMPIIFLGILNYEGLTDYVRERQYDSEEQNLNWTKNKLLYQRAVTKKAYEYLKNKYSRQKVATLYSNIYPLMDSDYNPIKPNFADEVVAYIGEREKENLRMIGVKLDSNLNVTEMYNQRVLDDTLAFKEKWSDKIQLINIIKDTIK